MTGTIASPTKGRVPLLHIALLLMIGFVVFQVGLMVTGHDEEPIFGINFSGDPSSLTELKGLGGGTEAPLTTDQMVRQADSVLEVSVVDIKRSYLNTANGAFPSEPELAGGAVDELLVLTDVEVRVLRDRSKGRLTGKGPFDGKSLHLGKRTGDGSGTALAGELMTVTVMGGAIQTRLSHGQATALGVMEVVEQFPDRSHHSTEHPDIEIERPATGQIDDFSYGISPSVSMSEGDDVVLVLETIEVPMVGGGQMSVLSLAHSSSVLHAGTAPGEWRVGTENGAEFRPGPMTLAMTDLEG